MSLNSAALPLWVEKCQWPSYFLMATDISGCAGFRNCLIAAVISSSQGFSDAGPDHRRALRGCPRLVAAAGLLRGPGHAYSGGSVRPCFKQGLITQRARGVFLPGCRPPTVNALQGCRLPG